VASEELPVAPGARALRVTLVLLLDATLLVWGFYLIRRWATEPVAIAAQTPAPTQTPTPTPTPSQTPTPTPNQNQTPTQTPPPNPPPTPSLSPPTPSHRVTSRGPDVLPARGTSLPSKPADPGVMKNPKAGDAWPPPTSTPSPPPAAVSPPDAPPVAELPPPEPSPPVAETPPPAPPPSAEPADGPPVDHPLAGLMTAGIRRVVDGHRPAILDCYRRAAKEGSPQEPPLQGRIEIHLRIQPAGDADDVRVVQNQTGSDALGDCLVAMMQTWRYPAPGQEAMEFVWPFTFRGRR